MLSDYERAEVDRLIAESQRPAPCEVLGPTLQRATPREAQDIREALDQAYGPDPRGRDAVAFASVAAALMCGTAGFVVGVLIARLWG